MRWRASNMPGTTGRIGVVEADFKMLNGYDEDLMGAGYQDMDIWHRWTTHGMRHCIFKRENAVGHSIPNHPDVQLATGSVKIQHVVNPLGLTWHQMNKHNEGRASQKLIRGLTRRNPRAQFHELGLPYLVVTLQAEPAPEPSTCNSFGVGRAPLTI